MNFKINKISSLCTPGWLLLVQGMIPDNYLIKDNSRLVAVIRLWPKPHGIHINICRGTKKRKPE